MRTLLLERLRVRREDKSIGIVNSTANQKEAMDDGIKGERVSQQTCCLGILIDELHSVP